MMSSNSSASSNSIIPSKYVTDVEDLELIRTLEV